MKTNTLQLLFFGTILFLVDVSANAQIKEAFTGDWRFEAPTAPMEYTFGIISFNKDSVFMTFPDSNYKFPSSWIKVKSDSIVYETNIDGTSVLFSLKIIDRQNGTGNAVWIDGKTLMILTKKDN